MRYQLTFRWRQICALAQGGLLAIVSLATLAHCERADSDEATEAVIAAWQGAQLSTAVFVSADMPALAPGACRQGKIDGLETIVCKYTDAAAAGSARAAALGHVGDTTGLAVVGDVFLLIVADRDNKDPSGRKINSIVQVFREHTSPPAASSSDGDGGAPAQGSGK